METHMVQIAKGDASKMARLDEIGSWFASSSELNQAVMEICRTLTVEEDERLTPDGMPKFPLEVVLWAMMEAESPDPAQAMK